MSARSKGSVRRLKTLGMRRKVKGSAQIMTVPTQRCSAKTNFQLL